MLKISLDKEEKYDNTPEVFENLLFQGKLKFTMYCFPTEDQWPTCETFKEHVSSICLPCEPIWKKFTISIYLIFKKWN